MKRIISAEKQGPKTRKHPAGFSTLEMLIAMTILVMTLSAVVLVSFSNQSTVIDSQTNSEALGIAQGLLEKAQADSGKDFKLVNPMSQPQSGVSDCPQGFVRHIDENDSATIYCKKVDVVMLPDFLTKKVTATIQWTGDHNRPQIVELSSLVTNYNNAIGGDTCDSVLTGNWQNPSISSYVLAGGDLLAPGTVGTYHVSDLDAYKNKLYVAVNNVRILGSATSTPTFFIFDTSTPADPQYLGSIDNNTDDASGLNAVAVAEDVTTGNIYAYVANGYGANFSTCSQGASCAQLQVINVTNPESPQIVAHYKISGVTGNNGQGVGSSIYYHGGFIYLGLTKPASGAEFHIIDVHNPAAPFEVPGGKFTTGKTINAVYIKNSNAYLAMAGNPELRILNISNSGSPTLIGNYEALGESAAKSISTVGDNLFLGRTIMLSDPELYILNNADPAQLQENNANPLVQEISGSVIDVIVRDHLVFTLTPAELQAQDITNPAAMTTYFSETIQGVATTMDCEGNYIYVGSNQGGQVGIITVVNGAL